MKTALITTRDPQGLHAVSLFEVVYNKAKLTFEEAQRFNENGGELQTDMMAVIRKHSATNQYANEETSSNYAYPKEYGGPKTILDQIKLIGAMFGLETAQAIEFAKNLPALPEGAEGWFAIPKVSAIAKKYFPAITDNSAQYCEAVKLVLEKIKSSRSFYNYREGQIVPGKLRQSARTANALEALEKEQLGDILIIAAQYGMRHRGQSVRRARETFTSNEFGLGAFAIGCMNLVHPERFIRFEELDPDCAGDEFSLGGDGVFSRAPLFGFSVGRLEFGTSAVDFVSGIYGSASAFLPQ